MERTYTNAERAYARLIGLQDDPYALELARRLRSANRIKDPLRRRRIQHGTHETLDDVLPPPRSEAA